MTGKYKELKKKATENIIEKSARTISQRFLNNPQKRGTKKSQVTLSCNSRTQI